MTPIAACRRWLTQRWLRRLIRSQEVGKFLDQLNEAHGDGRLGTGDVSAIVVEALGLVGLQGWESQWRRFFQAMPPHPMKRIGCAAAKARGERQKRAVMALCESTQDYANTKVGLKIAEQLRDPQAVRRFHEQAGDLARGDSPKDAARHYLRPVARRICVH